MKKFLMGLGILIVVLFLSGMVVLIFQLSTGIYLLPMAMLLFTLWVPLFLFYAYDRKQQRKELAEQSNPEGGNEN